MESDSFHSLWSFRAVLAPQEDVRRRWPFASTLTFCRQIKNIIRVDCFVDRTRDKVCCGAAISVRFEYVVDVVVLGRGALTGRAPAAARLAQVSGTSTSSWFGDAIRSSILLIPVAGRVELWSSGGRLEAAALGRRRRHQSRRQTTRRKVTATENGGRGDRSTPGWRPVVHRSWLTSRQQITLSTRSALFHSSDVKHQQLSSTPTTEHSYMSQKLQIKF